jgi:flagellar export protein FliJ
MAAGFSLQLVLDLAERQAEALSREVKRSHGEWLLARGQQVQAQAARDRIVQTLASDLAPGLSSARLAQRAQMGQARQAELRRAVQRVADRHAQWQARLAQWMQANARVKALKVLQRHYLDERAVQARRSEQREHDELAQNTRFWRQDQAEPA